MFQGEVSETTVRVKMISGSPVTLENLFPQTYRYRYRLEIRMNLFNYHYRHSDISFQTQGLQNEGFSTRLFKLQAWSLSKHSF